MRKREVFIGAGLGAVAALVVAPLIELVVQAVFGTVYAPEVFGGALIATLFFSVSAVTTAIYQDSPSLRTAVMLMYVIKTSLVFAALQTVRIDGNQARIFGISIAVSAVSYLFFQTIYIAKWRKLRYARR